MKVQEQIHPFRQIVPMIYAYNTPGVAYHEGWTKIGYTDRQTVKDRIKQQTHTANIHTELAWCDNAMYKDGSGEYFHDTDFHNFLMKKKIKREKGTEWFEVTGPVSNQYFNEFASRRTTLPDTGCEYILRKEQQEAVKMAASYFSSGGNEFLWNCKPRFGKTLSTYDLIRFMDAKHVLVVTNRPAIANSWAEDFQKFIAWRAPHMLFVSDTAALEGKDGVYTRMEYLDYCQRQADAEQDVPFLCFESLQNLKGSVYFGGDIDKLEWLTKVQFDLLVVDESQEGVDTRKTEKVFDRIHHFHTLYLSGTPFKQLASGKFSDGQIYNWTYADEQQAKEEWSSENQNPYARLPQLAMFTYQVSPMITGKIEQGIDLSDDDNNAYAFDLNEFFSTNDVGKFVHEEEIKKFLHALSTQEKYPFSTEKLRSELSHTMWYMNRVAAAKALEKLLREDPVFKEYHIVVAAGDMRGNHAGDDGEDTQLLKAYEKVKSAISKYPKTITLTVGQLTVGVTIPEWCAVLMLCNLSSPSAYMQAAFRAQNPCSFTSADGKRYEKETAYVFDFDPTRTLVIYDKFANDLMNDTLDGKGASEKRQENIKRLLNFFPVLGEDEQGTMVELDATRVLTIPRRLKCTEVVRRGFMSNFLFTNISNVFGAPQFVQSIINKLTPAQEESNKKKELSEPPNIQIGQGGDVEVPVERIIGTAHDIFGEKIYGTINEDVESAISNLNKLGEGTPREDIKKKFNRLKEDIKDTITEHIVPVVAKEYEITKGQQKKFEKNIESDVKNSLHPIMEEYEEKTKIAKIEREKKLAVAETQEQVKEADEEYKSGLQAALDNFNEGIRAATKNIIDNKPKEVIENLEMAKDQKKAKEYSDEIRDHLRGFSRTIPSFVMAYGDKNLTLSNLDDYTDDDVFHEVTGITEADFRLLRDGGTYVDPETGEEKVFAGHLFDEVVFNDSIQEFLKKKESLANYFKEYQTEDIFDYIPPQKTNQIFTPRHVVELMVDKLEEENPGCFDNPDFTYADLYMKSGLYIAEVVKRLFRSQGLKQKFPDERARIRHIFKNQVYGMAPTPIIYLIATNYILGFDEDLKRELTDISSAHFVQADAAEAAKEGTLDELVEQYFGGAKK